MLSEISMPTSGEVAIALLLTFVVFACGWAPRIGDKVGHKISNFLKNR